MKTFEKSEPRLMTQKEAARYLCVCEKKIYLMAKEGKLPAIRFDRCVRFDRADIDSFIESAKGVSR